jgi:processive 1,2-diacylglycerol beta-glucosyltransferase
MGGHQMKKALIFTTGEGHYSIAHAAKDYLKETYEVKVIKYPFRRMLNVYRQFYMYFPSLVKIPYRLGEKEQIANLAIKIYEKSFAKNVRHDILRYRPDIILSTYNIFNNTLVNFIKQQLSPVPFINIVANPYTLPVEFAPQATFNIVYDQAGIKDGRKNKIPSSRLVGAGWLVRKQYYQKYNRSAVLKQLGFSENTLTFFICGGSEGTNAIVKMMPALLLVQKPLQVIVVCGHNKTLLRRLKSVYGFYTKICHSNKKLASKIKINKRVKLKLFGFKNNLAPLIQASSLVVGKAGPNLLFEAIACQKPFMAIAHISGQEDCNLEIIKNKGLGYVEESPIGAIKLLKKIVNNPSVLAGFKNSVQKEAKYNSGAKQRLEKVMAKALKTPLK